MFDIMHMYDNKAILNWIEFWIEFWIGEFKLVLQSGNA